MTRIAPGQNQVPAHRMAYCVDNGLDLSDISEEMVRHKCDNRICVQPSHLELGSAKDNYADARKRGRHTRGELCGSACLEESTVRAIRDEYVPRSVTKGSNALAKKYGVAGSTILAIVNRRTWVHL